VARRVLVQVGDDRHLLVGIVLVPLGAVFLLRLFHVVVLGEEGHPLELAIGDQARQLAEGVVVAVEVGLHARQVRGHLLAVSAPDGGDVDDGVLALAGKVVQVHLVAPLVRADEVAEDLSLVDPRHRGDGRALDVPLVGVVGPVADVDAAVRVGGVRALHHLVIVAVGVAVAVPLGAVAAQVVLLQVGQPVAVRVLHVGVGAELGLVRVAESVAVRVHGLFFVVVVRRLAAQGQDEGQGAGQDPQSSEMVHGFSSRGAPVSICGLSARCSLPSTRMCHCTAETDVPFLSIPRRKPTLGRCHGQAL